MISSFALESTFYHPWWIWRRYIGEEGVEGERIGGKNMDGREENRAGKRFQLWGLGGVTWCLHRSPSLGA